MDDEKGYFTFSEAERYRGKTIRDKEGHIYTVVRPTKVGPGYGLVVKDDIFILLRGEYEEVEDGRESR